MMKYIAGGLAAGLGQGLTEVGRQNGLMKREQFLAQMEDQRAQRDRGWRTEDRQQDRDWGQEDRRETRDWQVEDREAGQGHDIAMSDRRHGQAVSLQGLSQKHQLALEDKRARRDFERDEISHGRAVALRNLDARIGHERDEMQHSRDLEKARAGGGSEGTAMVREVEYLANTLANSRGEELNEEHRLEAVRLRRSSSGDDAEQQRARQTIFSALVDSDRRGSKSSIEEKWAEASRMAGLEADSEPPPAQPAPAGLGAGVETVPAAGPASAQEQPAPAQRDDGQGSTRFAPLPVPPTPEERVVGKWYVSPNGRVAQWMGEKGWRLADGS